eukprot:5006158-Lingulodinium_polyedra.AAC.1
MALCQRETLPSLVAGCSFMFSPMTFINSSVGRVVHQCSKISSTSFFAGWGSSMKWVSLKPVSTSRNQQLSGQRMSCRKPSAQLELFADASIVTRQSQRFWQRTRAFNLVRVSLWMMPMKMPGKKCEKNMSSRISAHMHAHLKEKRVSARRHSSSKPGSLGSTSRSTSKPISRMSASPVPTEAMLSTTFSQQAATCWNNHSRSPRLVLLLVTKSACAAFTGRLMRSNMCQTEMVVRLLRISATKVRVFPAAARRESMAFLVDSRVPGSRVLPAGATRSVCSASSTTGIYSG